MTYEHDGRHLATCDKPIAACPACSDHFGLIAREEER
jgi:hypothetical protein